MEFLRSILGILIVVGVLYFGNQPEAFPQAIIDTWTTEAVNAIDKAEKKVWGAVVVVPDVKCACGGTKYIVHGDGHKTPCPCENCTCKSPNNPSPAPTGCQCGCGRLECKCGRTASNSCLTTNVEEVKFTGCRVYFGDNCPPCHLFELDFAELNRKWPHLGWNKPGYFVFEKTQAGQPVPRFEFWKNGVLLEEKLGYSFNRDARGRAIKDKDGFYGEIIKILNQHPNRK